jgi:hypothetical protein
MALLERPPWPPPARTAWRFAHDPKVQNQSALEATTGIHNAVKGIVQALRQPDPYNERQQVQKGHHPEYDDAVRRVQCFCTSLAWRMKVEALAFPLGYRPVTLCI